LRDQHKVCGFQLRFLQALFHALRKPHRMPQKSYQTGLGISEVVRLIQASPERHEIRRKPTHPAKISDHAPRCRLTAPHCTVVFCRWAVLNDKKQAACILSPSTQSGFSPRGCRAGGRGKAPSHPGSSPNFVAASQQAHGVVSRRRGLMTATEGGKPPSPRLMLARMSPNIWCLATFALFVPCAARLSCPMSSNWRHLTTLGVIPAHAYVSSSRAARNSRIQRTRLPCEDYANACGNSAGAVRLSPGQEKDGRIAGRVAESTAGE